MRQKVKQHGILMGFVPKKDCRLINIKELEPHPRERTYEDYLKYMRWLSAFETLCGVHKATIMVDDFGLHVGDGNGRNLVQLLLHRLNFDQFYDGDREDAKKIITRG